MAKDGGCPLRLFSALAALINGNNTAESASKGAADTRLMNNCAPSQEGGQDIVGGIRQPIVGHPREAVRRAQRPLCIVDVQAEIIFVGKTFNAVVFSGCF